MKILRITLLLIMGAFMFIQPVGAITSSTNASSKTIARQSFALRMEMKAQKKVAKLESFMQKAGMDLNDPVKKWLWLTLIAVVASIVLYAIGQNTLGYIASSAAGIFFVVWILKYLQVI